MVAGRTHETPGSETRGWITHGTGGSMSFMWVPIPRFPSVLGSKDDGPRWVLYTHKVDVTAEELKLRKAQIHPNPSKLWTKGRHYFHFTGQQKNKLVLQRDVLSLSFKTTLSAAILEEIVQSKMLSPPLLTWCEEIQKMNGELSLNTHILNQKH